MHLALAQTWQRCRTFVSDACRTRDSSHGLAHMESVTQLAVTLAYMNTDGSCSNLELLRIVLTGMLHDVADHKYDDANGSLEKRVRAFAEKECEGLVDLAKGDELPQTFMSPSERDRLRQPDAEQKELNLLMTAISAISYSKENKRGMGWFAKDLTPEWRRVRDTVSDADKLEAMGENGLLRCYAYACELERERLHKAGKDCAAPPLGSERCRLLEAQLLQKVEEHFEEKLHRLYTEFIVTLTGKFFGHARHTEMEETLAKWREEGPPPLNLFWR